MDLSQRGQQPCCLGPERVTLLVTLPHMPKTGPDSYPVPPVDVSPMAYQQLYHVRLVSQDSDVQGCVVRNGV